MSSPQWRRAGTDLYTKWIHVKQQSRLAAPLAVWVAGHHRTKSLRGCWVEISLKTEGLAHTAMIIQCCQNYTQACIAVLFIISKSWKQSRYPLVEEWISKLWYIQTTEYYSALKRNGQSSHEKTWGNFKCKLLCERSQSEKATYCTITNRHFRKCKTMETVKRSVVVRGWGWVGRMNKVEHSKILGQWKYSVWHYNDGCLSLPKPVKCTTPRVNHNVNYGLWVIRMCQCRFIYCNKCTTLVRDVIMGEAMYLWGNLSTVLSILLWT